VAGPQRGKLHAHALSSTAWHPQNPPSPACLIAVEPGRHTAVPGRPGTRAAADLPRLPPPPLCGAQVNARLAKEEAAEGSVDAAHPKQQWPPKEACPRCYKGGEEVRAAAAAGRPGAF